MVSPILGDIIHNNCSQSVMFEKKCSADLDVDVLPIPSIMSNNKAHTLLFLLTLHACHPSDSDVLMEANVIGLEMQCMVTFNQNEQIYSP